MSTMPTWGIVATVREAPDVIEKFVAHHLIIGANEITLYFDDPNDPALSRVAHLDRVTAIACDTEHWSFQRPAAHQRRQKHNANEAYRSARTDWIIHIDADELISSKQPVGEILSRQKPEVRVVRLGPAEAFVNPKDAGLSIFRLPLPTNKRGARIGAEAYGIEYPLLRQGFLSHVAGKHFTRSAVDGLVLSIHGPKLNGLRANGDSQDDMLLLHLHGGNETDWLAKVHRRMETGVYRAATNDARRGARQLDGRGLNAHLQNIFDTDGTDGLRAFFRRVSVFDRAKRKLRRLDLLIKKRLWLEEKVATVFCEDARLTDLGIHPETGELEGNLDLNGVAMRVGLEQNYTEVTLALGRPDEAEEMARIRELVRGKPVDFYDVGANVGLYSLIVAQSAASESSIVAFEPNQQMADKLIRNRDLNSGFQIELHRCALGDRSGEVALSLPDNPGQATILPNTRDASSLTVPLRMLVDFVRPRQQRRLSLLKIDIEGAEPLCMVPFFKAADPDCWPDYILYEHAHTDIWSVPVERVFPFDVYEVCEVFRNNTLLSRKNRAN